MNQDLPNYNPYAPPAELGEDDSQSIDTRQMLRATQGLWRDGEFLIARRGEVFPPICVKTGLPATRQLLIQMRLNSILPAIGFLLGCFPGMLIFTMFQSSRAVRVCISQQAYKQQNAMAIQGLLVSVLGIGCILAGAAIGPEILGDPQPLTVLLVILGALLTIGGVGVMTTARNPLTAVAFHPHYTIIRGAGKEFLALLPEFSHSPTDGPFSKPTDASAISKSP